MAKERKEEILSEAKKLCKEKGYKGATMAQIAKRSNVSLGTLYKYFSSKEQLFKAMNCPELKEYDPENEIRRQTILHKSLKLFSEKGYSSTTMDTIAASCGYSKVVLYQFFKSKEDLFGALFSNVDLFGGYQTLTVDTRKTPLRKFLKLSGMMFLELFEDPDRLGMMRIVISEIHSFPEAGEIMYENTVNRLAKEIAAYLACYAKLKPMKQMDFKLASRSFLGMLYSFVLSDKILYPAAKQYSNQQITDFAVDLFEDGLKNG